ncbi:MAG: DUF6128 domain-containing protein [Clostridia bacterium]|nr:DUF6128 domain-containing protein [Clostridia bacterium]MDY5554967.1 DUF6128 domain-containing protein [Blautia sp.]
MSGYRRFIAYVYEYSKGKKSRNCGFIKVEVKEQRCTVEVHLNCPGILPDIPCDVYGFIRKDGLINGIHLGSCKTKTNSVNCLIESNSLNMSNSGISFGQMGGIILITQSGSFFGTEWDDMPVRPENFQEFKPSPPVPEKTEKGPVPVQKEIPEESENNTIQKQPDTEENIKEEADPIPEKPDEADLLKQQSTDDLSDDAPVSLPFGEEFYPFSDGEFITSWKIHPRDLIYFPKQCNFLQNNRFLQYGYYNFGHLFLGLRSNGQYFLGIPGGYNQQERFMANMFGFPYFKESTSIELPRMRGGYWYRPICAPNLN